MERFRHFVLAHALINAAELMQQFTVGWLAIQLAIRDGRPEQGPIYLGAIAVGRLLTGFVVGLPGGVLADSIERARLLKATAIASAVILAAFALVLSMGHGSLPSVVVFGALLAGSFTLDAPARLSIAPLLVDAPRAVSAIGMTRIAVRITGIIAPLAAGALIVRVGTSGVLLVCAALYAASVLRIATLGPVTQPTPGLHREPFHAFREGLTYLARERTLRAYVIAIAFYLVLAAPFTHVLPAVVHDSLGAGSLELSWLAGAWGLGGLLGAATVATMARWRHPGNVLVANAVVLGVLLVIFGSLRSLTPMLGIAALIGWSAVVFDGGAGTILQLNAPDHIRGRLLGLIYLIYGVGTQAGVLTLGILATVFGISSAIAFAGVAMIGVGLAMSQVRVIRDAWPRRIPDLT